MNELMEKIAEDAFVDELEKISEELSYIDIQKGLQRAASNSDGTGLFIGSKKYRDTVRAAAKKGAAEGGLVGATTAGMLSLIASNIKGGIKPMRILGRAAAGGLFGSAVGSQLYGHDAGNDFFKERGITPKGLFHQNTTFSPEAKKKYIDAYKNK